MNVSIHDLLAQDDETLMLALNSGDLRAAVRALRALIEAWDQSSASQGPRVIATSAKRRPLTDQAQGAVERRKLRASHFGSGMFGEPAWDMLLVLYTQEARDRLKVSRLVESSGASSTTGLRWLEYLEAQQWVSRRADPTDGRASFVELTEKGRAALDSYFSETLKTMP